MSPMEVQLTTDAVMALEQGNVIEAIKIVRQATGLGLKESKDAVDAYLAAHPELRERARGSGADANRLVLFALALLALVGGVVLLLLARRG